MLFICGLAYMSDSIEVSLLSYLSLSVANEWNLSGTELATITSVVFTGSLFGASFLWGPVADRYGRRISFITGSLMISLFSILSAFSPNYICLLLARFIVGIGVGCGFVPFDLLAELLPPSHRGKYLMNINYFWTMGSIIVNGLAWLLLQKYGWRLFTIMATLPVILSVALSILYLPESPRWLLLQNRHKDAEDTIYYAANVNNTELTPFHLLPLTSLSGNNNNINNINSNQSSNSVNNPVHNNHNDSNNFNNNSGNSSLNYSYSLTEEESLENNNNNNNNNNDDNLNQFQIEENLSNNISLPTAFSASSSSCSSSIHSDTSSSSLIDSNGNETSENHHSSSPIILSLSPTSPTHPSSPSRSVSNTSQKYEDEIVDEAHVIEDYIYLLKGDYAKITLPLWVVYFSYGLTYYGVILFISRLYSSESTESHNNNDDNNNNGNNGGGNDNNNSSIISFDYFDIFTNACSEIIGVLIASNIIDIVGRRASQITLYSLASISALLLPFTSNHVRYAISLISRISIISACGITWVATPELYPTSLRAIGHSICASISRIGAILSPYVVQNQLITEKAIGVILFIVNLFAVISIFYLPETFGQNMESIKKRR